MISIKSNFIEITLWREFSPADLLHVFKRTFSKNISGGLLVLFQAGTFGRGSQYRKIQTITRLQTLSDEAAEAVFRSCLSK